MLRMFSSVGPGGTPCGSSNFPVFRLLYALPVAAGIIEHGLESHGERM